MAAVHEEERAARQQLRNLERGRATRRRNREAAERRARRERLRNIRELERQKERAFIRYERELDRAIAATDPDKERIAFGLADQAQSSVLRLGAMITRLREAS